MKIISYSVFGVSGRNGNYWAYMPSLLRAHSLLFPDYKIVLYHDDILSKIKYGKVLERLDSENFLDLHYMGPKDALCKSMLWRCKAIWDYPNAKAVFFRDMDTCPTYRERCANEEFVNSKFYVHGINAVKQHSVPLMGGLWGCKPKHFIRLTKYTSWEVFTSLWTNYDLSTHGSDQLFLRDKVLDFVRQDIMIHKIITIRNFPEIDNDVKTKDKYFIPYIGAAGYARTNVIKFCNTKDTPFINKLKSIELEHGIDAIMTHAFVKI